jgi:hypothetical protein
MHPMLRKQLKVPPAVGRQLREGYARAYFATNDSIKKDEIAVRRAWLLSQRLAPRDKPLKRRERAVRGDEGSSMTARICVDITS